MLTEFAVENSKLTKIDSVNQNTYYNFITDNATTYLHRKPSNKKCVKRINHQSPNSAPKSSSNRS